MLVRAFRDLNNFRTLGIIGVRIDNKKLRSLISKSSTSDDEKIIILNEDNEIICSVGNFHEFMQNSEIVRELEKIIILLELSIKKKDGRSFVIPR